MYWVIYIKMWSHDRSSWHWAHCCRVESAEMLGIVERALHNHQGVKVEEKRHESPSWAKFGEHPDA